MTEGGQSFKLCRYDQGREADEKSDSRLHGCVTLEADLVSSRTRRAPARQSAAGPSRSQDIISSLFTAFADGAFAHRGIFCLVHIRPAISREGT